MFALEKPTESGLSWSPYLGITIVGPKAEPPHVFQKQNQCGFQFLYQKDFFSAFSLISNITSLKNLY